MVFLRDKNGFILICMGFGTTFVPTTVVTQLADSRVSKTHVDSGRTRRIFVYFVCLGCDTSRPCGRCTRLKKPICVDRETKPRKY